MTDRRLAALVAVANLVRDRDLAALAVASRKCALIDAELASLAHAARQRAEEVSLQPQADAALAAGVDGKWLEFLDRQRMQLRRDLAAAHARLEQAKSDAARALGRADVLDHLSRHWVE